MNIVQIDYTISMPSTNDINQALLYEKNKFVLLCQPKHYNTFSSCVIHLFHSCGSFTGSFTDLLQLFFHFFLLFFFERQGIKESGCSFEVPLFPYCCKGLSPLYKSSKRKNHLKPENLKTVFLLSALKMPIMSATSHQILRRSIILLWFLDFPTVYSYFNVQMCSYFIFGNKIFSFF